MEYQFNKYFLVGEIVTFRWNSAKSEYGIIVKLLDNGVVHIKKVNENFVPTQYLCAFQTDSFTPICKINCAHQGSNRASLPAPCSPWCVQYNKTFQDWEFLSNKWNHFNSRWRY